MGLRIARVQLDPHSDIGARDVAAVTREVDWLGATGDERIFHPLCGPGTYASVIRRSSGCRWYVGHDINASAVRWGRQRNPDRDYVFRTARFGVGTRVPRHDLALLSYEAVNVFAPDELPTILAALADGLAPGGRLFIDVRTPDDPGVPIGVRRSEHVPAGTGIFSTAEHDLDYATQLDCDGRLLVQRFRLRFGHRDEEFFSWLWLYEPDELVALGRAAGLWPSATAHLHPRSVQNTNGANGSVQMLFERSGAAAPRGVPC